MTTKLTLTMDDGIIDAAKIYAQKKGKSLSGIVENYLKSITANEITESPLLPKVTKLMGVIQLPGDFDYKKDLGNAMAEKYK
ncbi:MAG TPA: DUF6364 family protein [Mucilaginibacter sp.]